MELKDEVDITEEMIQVATEILWESGCLESKADGMDQLVVEEMLRAALSLHMKEGDGGAASS